MNTRLILACAASCLALAASTAAHSQEVRGPESPNPTSAGLSPATTAEVDAATDASGDQLGDIVVTARKVSENAQDVPIAVTAFSGAELQNQSAVQLTDVARLTPSLQTRPSTTPGATIFAIRGQIGATDAASDPAVGIYVDGLYWARAVGLDVDLLDVQSVQVLKGPQGTLFGRNTTGGAIVLQTNDPTFDGVAGQLSGTYGRFNERGGSAILNLPLARDVVSLRVAGSFYKRDGYIENIDGTELADRDSWNARAKLLIKPAPNISLLLSGEVYHSDSYLQPYQPVYVGANSALNFPVGQALFGAVTTAEAIALRTTQGRDYYQGLIAEAKRDEASIDNLTRLKTLTQTYSGTLNVDTFFGAIKVIAGYRDLDTKGNLDFDATPVPLLYLPYNQQITQKSIEAQATGKAFGGAVDFAAGLFAFKEFGDDDAPFYSFARVPATGGTIRLAQLTNYLASIRTRSQGMYGQASWHITDRLTVTGGLRYSVEDKGIVVRTKTATGACGLQVAVQPLCEFRRHDDYDGLSYTAGVDYKFTDDLLVYGKISRAFRSGGQNLRAVGPIEATRPFGPETITAYEAGLKSEFLDRRVRLNLAGFINIADGLQRATVTAVTIGGVTSSTRVNSNFGTARFYGGEAELLARLFTGFDLSASATYLNSSYIKFIDPGTGIDRRGELFIDPEYTFSLAGTYRRDFGFGKLLLRADYSYSGKRYLLSLPFSPVKDPLYSQKVGATTVGANGTLNARLGVTVADGNLDLAAFVRNATNNRVLVAANNQPFDLTTAIRREPRTFGATATYRFGGF